MTLTGEDIRHATAALASAGIAAVVMVIRARRERARARDARVRLEELIKRARFARWRRALR